MIYIRGKVDKVLLVGQVDISEPGVEDRKLLDKFVGEFVESFPDLGLNIGHWQGLSLGKLDYGKVHRDGSVSDPG